MEGVGLSVGELNKKNLASRRFKKGECPTCGNKTHKVGFFGKRIALTIEGQSLYGRCLLCHPVEGYAKRPDQPGSSKQPGHLFVPRTLELEDRYHDDDDDNGTMVSGITMDHRLVVGARNWRGGGEEYEEGYDSASGEEFEVISPTIGAGRRRPEASVGGDDGHPRRPPGRDASLYVPGGATSQPTRFTSHDVRMDAIGSNMNLTMETQTKKGRGRKSSMSRPQPMGGESIMENSISELSALRDKSPSSRRGGSPRLYNSRGYDEENSMHSSDSTRLREIRVHPFPTTTAPSYPIEARDLRAAAPNHDRFVGVKGDSKNDKSWNGSVDFVVGGSQEFAVGIPHAAITEEFVLNNTPKKSEFVPRDGAFRGGPAPLAGYAPKNTSSGGLLDDDDDEHSAFRDIRVPSRTAQPAVMNTLPPAFQKSQSSFQQASDSSLQCVPSFARSMTSEFAPTVRFGVGFVEEAPTERTLRGTEHGDQYNTSRPPDAFGVQAHGRYGGHHDEFAMNMGVPSSEQYDAGEDDFIVLETAPKERFSEGSRRQDPYAEKTGSNSQQPEPYGLSQEQHDFRSDLGRIDNRFRPNTTEVDSSSRQERNRRGMPDGDGTFSSSSQPGVSPIRGKKATISVDTPDTAETSSRSGPSVASAPPPRAQDYNAVPTPEVPKEATEEARPHDNYMRVPPTMTNLTVQNIPVILNSLDQANDKQKENAFRNLAQIVFLNGQKAKIHSKQYYAIETLIDFMWSDMGNPDVLAGCCEYLFALAASTDGEPQSDAVTGVNAEGAIDALLISMQSHCSVESIQRSGMGTLCCLAQASSNNPEINDGTLSGAVLCVTNAMDAHRASFGVQEWGIRALHSQCIQSANAESNKASLVKAGSDGGAGLDVIARAMETLKNDVVSLEWSCRLYWCLSASDDITSSATSVHVLAIMNAVRAFSKRSSTSSLIEAAYGALANFSRNDQISVEIVDSGFVPIVIDSMRHYTDDEGVNIEACGLLSNLAQVQENKNEIMQSDGVATLCRVIQFFPKSSELQEEAIGALLCLAVGSDEAKKSMCTKSTFSLLVKILLDRHSSVSLHETACSFVGSLCTLEEPAQLASAAGVVDAILSAIKVRPRERKVLEAAMMALRNIVCNDVGLDPLLGLDAIRTICNAMDSGSDSESVQLNGCYILWSICAKANQEPVSVVDAGGIEQIVKSMQSHMESAHVLEMACGALWSLADKSDDRKSAVVNSGGIDAITCALIMHPTETRTLETACGVLSNISVKRELASVLADAQGISIIVEAMRNNASSLYLLEFGTIVLRNIVLTNPGIATEASNGISSIIQGMKDHPDAISFNVEACNALWGMAAQSADCKSKIHELDGVTVLMGALDHHNSVIDVQDAARGAISQLAMPSSP
jgi:hypothetical protein